MAKALKKLLAGIALAIGVAAPTNADSLYLRLGPPPPRAEHVYIRPHPGWAWVGGRWQWHHGHWVWVGGYWAPPPWGRAEWVPGYWVRRPDGWIWIEGHWA